MFLNAKIFDLEEALDVELLEIYIVEYLYGVIREEYDEVNLNITFIDGFKEVFL